jgi:biofilm PGA synthesis N-glycosyltransferase PgaC
MLIGAYMTITLYLLLNILPDEHMNMAKKLQMSLYTPVMYFVFYLMNFVQLAAIFRCIFNFRQTLNLRQGSGTWISPKRAGEQQIQFS